MTDQNKPLTNAQLQLGDIVMFSDEPYGRQMCVQHITKDGWMELFTPYIHRDDFSTTSGILCYVGIASPLKIRVDDTRQTWVLIDRIKVR